MPTRIPNLFGTYAFLDRSNEASASHINLLSAATAPQKTALKNALQAFSACMLRNFQESWDTLVTSATPGTGQREMKYLVKCHSAVTFEKFTISVPGVRASTVYKGATDEVDMVGDADAAAFKTALEAAGCSGQNENALVVDSIWVTRGRK